VIVTTENHRQSVVKIAQELLLDEEDRSSITPELISQKLDLVLGMNPKWGCRIRPHCGH
jgi:hypothetical protein